MLKSITSIMVGVEGDEHWVIKIIESNELEQSFLPTHVNEVSNTIIRPNWFLGLYFEI